MRRGAVKMPETSLKRERRVRAPSLALQACLGHSNRTLPEGDDVMDRESGGYLGAPRHPLPCLLFLLPLLVAYEGGVLWLGGSQADALRNGADVWVRLGLASLGLRHVPVAGLLVLLVFAVRSWQAREEWPADLFNV